MNCYGLKSDIKRYVNSLQLDYFLIFKLPYSVETTEYQSCVFIIVASKSHTTCELQTSQKFETFLFSKGIFCETCWVYAF